MPYFPVAIRMPTEIRRFIMTETSQTVCRIITDVKVFSVSIEDVSRDMGISVERIERVIEFVDELPIIIAEKFDYAIKRTDIYNLMAMLDEKLYNEWLRLHRED